MYTSVSEMAIVFRTEVPEQRVWVWEALEVGLE